MCDALLAFAPGHPPPPSSAATTIFCGKSGDIIIRRGRGRRRIGSSPLLDVFPLFFLSPQSETTIINEGRRRSTSPGAKEWGKRPPLSLQGTGATVVVAAVTTAPAFFRRKRREEGASVDNGCGNLECLLRR